MKQKKEIILLDARVLSVINPRAFRAELQNGHEVTAFLGKASGVASSLERGSWIQIEMSPFDMSKGEIKTILGK